MRARALRTPWAVWPVALVSAGIGVLSVVAGVGGGAFTVPFLAARGLRPAEAIGTAGTIAFALSVVGVGCMTLGPRIAGDGAAGLGVLVWWPGALTVGVCASVTTPIGVRAAHRRSASALQRTFAGVLLLAAVTVVGKAWLG